MSWRNSKSQKISKLNKIWASCCHSLYTSSYHPNNFFLLSILSDLYVHHIIKFVSIIFIMQTRWCVIHIITMWKFSEESVVLMVELLNRINLINYQCDVRWEMANATNRITHKVSDKSGLPSLPSLTSSLNLLNSRLVTLFIIFSHNNYWIHLCFHWKFRRIFSSYLHWHDMKVKW